MLLKQRLDNPHTLIRIGLIFLILANISRWLLERASGQTDGIADGGIGALFGISIACMLLGIRKKVQRRAESSEDGCAC